MQTTVIHIKDAPSGWRSDPRYVFIGRGSKWGNQYSHLANSAAKYHVATRRDAVESFRKYQLPGLLSSLGELRGKILVCFCHPEECHGHVLAEAADQA